MNIETTLFCLDDLLQGEWDYKSYKKYFKASEQKYFEELLLLFFSFSSIELNSAKKSLNDQKQFCVHFYRFCKMTYRIKKLLCFQKLMDCTLLNIGEVLLFINGSVLDNFIDSLIKAKYTQAKIILSWFYREILENYWILIKKLHASKQLPGIFFVFPFSAENKANFENEIFLPIAKELYQNFWEGIS